ncbi:MAG: phenylacetate--CoA ligase family protein [Deltaproteobacteria bacterium]|nr:phenylacetate--CoA ligase family protein [Deltaproteobacteria bacterium]
MKIIPRKDSNEEFWNREMETMSWEQMMELHNEKFLKQIKYIFENSEFYKNKFAEANVDLGDIKGIEDITKLPFTVKMELRDSQLEAPPLGKHMACQKSDVARIYTTSGTTGRPTFIGVTHNDIEVWREAAARAFWCGGFRPDTIIPLIVSPFFIAASYADALSTIGTVIPIGVGATERVIAAYQYCGANAVLATSSFPLHFAASCRKRGVDPTSLGIKIILAGGEPGASTPTVRNAVEGTFGCLFLEMMGNGDMCSQMWSECRYKRGMHFVAQGIVHPEIIDPDTLEIQEWNEGAKGELVLTSLDRECIPLVRFRTRDHIEVTQMDCECGRNAPGIRVIGRTDDMINVQGVNVFPSAVRDYVAKYAPKVTGAIEIQIHEAPPEGWKPPIHIKVEHGKEPGDLDELKDELQKMLREKLIFRSDIELVPPDSLPKFEYKAKLVRKLYEEK